MKKKRKFKKEFRTGLVLGFLVMCIFFLVITLTLVNSTFFGFWVNKMSITGFDEVSYSWQSDKLVSSVSDACSLQKDDKMKLLCVYTFICGNFNYSRHGFHNELRISPEEIISKGGTCRDYSVLYSSILNRMNISNSFVALPEHIYSEVYIGNKTYILDQCMLGEVK